MSRSVLRGWPLAGLAFVVACAETAPVGPVGQPSLTTTPPPGGPFGVVELCKVGTAATFDVTLNGAASTESLNAGECRELTGPATGLFGLIAFTLTEQPQAGVIVLDSIKVDSTVVTGSAGNRIITGANTFSQTVHGDIRWTVTFYNRPVEPPPPPGGGEGCTPGYWKQEQHFDSWPAPYTPFTLFSAVFEDAFPGKTLVQVAALGGGGLNALGRHTVAALLNGASSEVDADLGAQQVIDAFNAVFPSGDYEGQKNIFAASNEQGCPLN